MSKLLLFKELFPSRLSFFIFVAYIILFVNQGILVTASQSSSKRYDYNIVTVVLLTELLKLIISVILYCKDEKLGLLCNQLIINRSVLLLYFVPAFLYCLYNNLSFYNLSIFDPTTYFILLQFRVAITGILFQCVFKKILTAKQWISLLILTVGCMLKQINFEMFTAPSTQSNIDLNKLNIFNLNIVFILLQMLCSCFAGVYNEYLLKNPGEKLNIYLQNIFMYLDSIVCNLLLLVFQHQSAQVFTLENFDKLLNYKVVLVMLNNAFIGIVTSFFLKTLNSILKNFASALELVLTAIMSYFLFGIPIYLNTIFSIVTIMLAIYLYSQNPIQNQRLLPCDNVRKDGEEAELLIEEVLIKT